MGQIMTSITGIGSTTLNLLKTEKAITKTATDIIAVSSAISTPTVRNQPRQLLVDVTLVNPASDPRSAIKSISKEEEVFLYEMSNVPKDGTAEYISNKIATFDEVTRPAVARANSIFAKYQMAMDDNPDSEEVKKLYKQYMDLAGVPPIYLTNAYDATGGELKGKSDANRIFEKVSNEEDLIPSIVKLIEQTNQFKAIATVLKTQDDMVQELLKIS